LNSKLRDELLNGEVFYSLAEAQLVIEGWRQHHNPVRPHSSLGYKPARPSAKIWPSTRSQPVTSVAQGVADKPTVH
jgi:putative transposase